MGTRNEGIIKLVPQGKLSFQLKYYKATPAENTPKQSIMSASV